MDIFGSALISPSVSWAINRNMASSSSRKRTRESDDEDTTEPDQLDRSGKYSNYQSGVETPLVGKGKSLRGKFKELFRRANGSNEEAQSLLVSSRSTNKPIIPRDKIKIAGKRFRKALHQSIKYMAIGMENMGTMIYISTNVPSSVYYNRNNDNYYPTMPYY